MGESISCAEFNSKKFGFVVWFRSLVMNGYHFQPCLVYLCVFILCYLNLHGHIVDEKSFAFCFMLVTLF